MIASDTSFVRLRSWLSREALGSEQDLRSPFWSSSKGSSRTWIPREELVKSFKARFESVEVGDGYLRDLLLETELGQMENISPQSTYLPWEKDGPEKVAEVYRDKPRPKDLNIRALERAIDRAVALMPTNSIRIKSIEEVLDRAKVSATFEDVSMDTHTNSGPPWFVNPWKPNGTEPRDKALDVSAAFDFIVQRSRAQMSELLSGNTVTWNAIAAKRLSQKKDPMKRKRLVIALEKAEPVIWKTFTPELQRQALEVKMPGGLCPFVAWNDLPIVDQGMQLVLDVAGKGNRTVIGGDYSAYDASLGPWLIELAGQVVGKWVYKGDKLVSALAASMANGVNLITPSGIWKAGPSSMKSGSGGTNLLDTVVNLLVMFYGEEVGAYKIVNCAAQGDDFILDAIGANPEAIHEVASSFGLEAHPEKQMYKPKAVGFLQRIHYQGWTGGIASAFRTLGSIMSYERMAYRPEEWSSWVDIVRALSQLENAAFSPWFETLVNFVKEGDKYALGSSLTPSEVMQRGGNAANDWVQRELGKPNKSKDRNKPLEDGFSSMAVNGVLRGRVTPSPR